jgi:hypothetical protein
VNAVKYQILVGRDSHEATQVAWESSAPPDQPLPKLPFLQTWWTVRVTDAWGTTSWADARSITQTNSTPIADASATQPLVIVPLNCNPTIVLDASLSWDPDNDVLHYFWFHSGAATPFATGVVAVATLPMGTNLLTLAVDDGAATNTVSFQVNLVTPEGTTGDLIALVKLQADEPDPLMESLQAAINSMRRRQANSAINQLQAFENKVRAQVDGPYAVLRENFIQRAQRIIEVLEHDCSCARPHGHVVKVLHVDGKALFQFSAPRGFTYIIESSTNLVDWRKIGVASELGSGEFQFEDATLQRLPSRFYRVVIPEAEDLDGVQTFR